MVAMVASLAEVNDVVEVGAGQEDPPFADVATERLEADVTTLAGQLAAGECRLLLMVAELDRREAWKEWGTKSCAHWLNFQCGIDIGAARERVRVAHRIGELPRIRAEFGHGRLSYSKVRALTRVASAETEDDLVEIALDTSASQLERVLRAYRKALPGEVDAARRGFLDRNVSWHHGEHGELVLQARLTAEGGAAVVAAIEAAVQKDRDVSAETSWGQRRADALVAVAEAATAARARDEQATTVSNVVVVADVAVLADDDPDGCCHLADGPTLAPETARRLACDAGIDLVVLAGDGSVLDVGRRTRSIPPALRRAVLVRDGCCDFPTCSDRIADVHHVRHWAKGGRTSLENAAGLCRYHHFLVHEGGYTIRIGTGGTRTYLRPGGRPVLTEAAAPRSATAPIEDANALAGIDVGAGGCAPRNPEGRIDAHYVADVLAGAHELHWN